MNGYKAIFKDSVRGIFNDYVSSLSIPLIDYVAIGIQDTIQKCSTSIMSRIEWQKTFKALDFADHDPLRLAAFNSPRNVIPFDELDYLNSLGKEVMQQRKKYEICNGLIILERHLGYNYLMTLGTGYSKFSGSQFYCQYHTAINRSLQDLKQLIASEAEVYKWAKNPHNVDAR